MSPQPLVTVQERAWLSPLGTAAQRVSQRLVDAYSTKAEEWSRQLDAFKTQLQSFKPETSESTEVLAALDRLSEEYEAHAEIRATLSRRLIKRVRRDLKDLFKIDPSPPVPSRAPPAMP